MRNHSNTTITHKVYYVWKAKPNGDPIPGTGRMLSGDSKRAVIRHLAYEEGIVWKHNDVSVKCTDGTVWHIS